MNFTYAAAQNGGISAVLKNHLPVTEKPRSRHPVCPPAPVRCELRNFPHHAACSRAISHSNSKRSCAPSSSSTSSSSAERWCDRAGRYSAPREASARRGLRRESGGVQHAPSRGRAGIRASARPLRIDRIGSRVRTDRAALVNPQPRSRKSYC